MNLSDAHGGEQSNTEDQDQNNIRNVEDYDDEDKEYYERAKSEEYTGVQSILFADPEIFKKFFSHNAPHDLTNEEQS